MPGPVRPGPAGLPRLRDRAVAGRAHPLRRTVRLLEPPGSARRVLPGRPSRDRVGTGRRPVARRRGVRRRPGRTRAAVLGVPVVRGLPGPSRAHDRRPAVCRPRVDTRGVGDDVRTPVSLTVQLLGRPRVVHGRGGGYQVRSRKSWALLAYLILTDRPPTRRQLASLLFAEADDPLRALRWSLAELRRALGDDVSLDGDPVVLQLPDHAVVDVQVVTRGWWSDAVGLPALGAELLEGTSIDSAPGFASWLLSEQRRVSAASEAILHEAALGSMAGGAPDVAREYAVRALAMSPLDENHHALLIRLYRLAGDDAAAESQFRACTELFERELGVRPGVAVTAATEGEPSSPSGGGGRGIDQRRRRGRFGGDLRRSRGRRHLVACGQPSGWPSGRAGPGPGSGRGWSLPRLSSIPWAVSTRRAWPRCTRPTGSRPLTTTRPRQRPLGPSSATSTFFGPATSAPSCWLNEALELAQGSVSVSAKATTYLGSVESDRADYAQAVALLEESSASPAPPGSRGARPSGSPCWGGSRCCAVTCRRPRSTSPLRSIWRPANTGWHCCRGRRRCSGRRCCWAATTRPQPRPCSRRLPAPARSATRAGRGWPHADWPSWPRPRERSTGRSRCSPTRACAATGWLTRTCGSTLYILDAQAELGRRHRHPDTRVFVDTLRTLASRTGMRELTVRAMLHGAALGHRGDAAAAVLLAADIDNPLLGQLREGRFRLTFVTPVARTVGHHARTPVTPGEDRHSSRCLAGGGGGI